MAIRELKEIKGIQLKRRNKTITVCRDLIIYLENPKDATKKLLELINEFDKVAVYKIKTQKLIAFLYTITMKDQKEKLGKPSHLSLHQKE